jgi:hypothetical protein
LYLFKISLTFVAWNSSFSLILYWTIPSLICLFCKTAFEISVILLIPTAESSSNKEFDLMLWPPLNKEFEGWLALNMAPMFSYCCESLIYLFLIDLNISLFISVLSLSEGASLLEDFSFSSRMRLSYLCESFGAGDGVI